MAGDSTKMGEAYVEFLARREQLDRQIQQITRDVAGLAPSPILVRMDSSGPGGLDDLGPTLDSVNDKVGKASQSMMSFGRASKLAATSLIAIGAPGSQLAMSLAKVQIAFDTLNTVVPVLSAKVSGLGTALAFLTRTPIGLAITAVGTLLGAVVSLRQEGESLGDTVLRMTDWFHGLASAAEKAADGDKKLADSIERIAKTRRDLANIGKGAFAIEVEGALADEQAARGRDMEARRKLAEVRAAIKKAEEASQQQAAGGATAGGAFAEIARMRAAAEESLAQATADAKAAELELAVASKKLQAAREEAAAAERKAAGQRLAEATENAKAAQRQREEDTRKRFEARKLEKDLIAGLFGYSSWDAAMQKKGAAESTAVPKQREIAAAPIPTATLRSLAEYGAHLQVAALNAQKDETAKAQLRVAEKSGEVLARIEQNTRGEQVARVAAGD